MHRGVEPQPRSGALVLPVNDGIVAPVQRTRRSLPRRTNFPFSKLSGGLAVAAGILALWPALSARLDARRARARVDALAAAARDGVAVGALDSDFLPDAGLRLRQLGPLLSSWETVGGCGAGGATDSGVGVRWIGRNTTGGLFQSMLVVSYIAYPTTGYDLIFNEQLTRDITPRLTVGAIIPMDYKYYANFGGIAGLNVTNSGIGDMALLGNYKLGPTNSTSIIGKVGLPTGTWNASYLGTEFTPDKQLGFGKVTGSLLLEHTFDQTWGLVLLGTSANYRGGNNPDGTAYRAPGATAYGFAGYFWGPLVPSVGMQLAAFTQQDTRGSYGENLNTPVMTAALNASLEWSNDYVALLLGGSFPFAIQNTWGQYGGLGRQPYILGLGVSVSPF
jgi:hypothetical protein